MDAGKEKEVMEAMSSVKMKEDVLGVVCGRAMDEVMGADRVPRLY